VKKPVVVRQNFSKALHKGGEEGGEPAKERELPVRGGREESGAGEGERCADDSQTPACNPACPGRRHGRSTRCAAGAPGIPVIGPPPVAQGPGPGDAKEGGLGGTCGGGGGISQRGKGSGPPLQRAAVCGWPVPGSPGWGRAAGNAARGETGTQKRQGREKGCRLAVSCARLNAHDEHDNFS